MVKVKHTEQKQGNENCKIENADKMLTMINLSNIGKCNVISANHLVSVRSTLKLQRTTTDN